MISIFLAVSVVLAWTGVIAETGDIITVEKWNELVTYIDAKLSPTNIIWSGSVLVSSSWSDVTIAYAPEGVAPYISSEPTFVPSSATVSIEIEWEYITPATTVSIPWFDGTINSTTVTSPTSLSLNLTTTATIGEYDLVLANGSAQNTVWPGNGANQFDIDVSPTGTWPAWVYTEDFEVGVWNWIDSPGLVAFTRNQGWTPSWQTGPSGGAGWSTWYVYTEATGANNPNVDFGIETSHFSQIQSISFDYHMYGDGGWMWSFEFQTFYAGVWTTQWSLSWTQQTANGDPYINQFIDLSTIPVESIRFFTTSWDYRSDVAVDNVVITSI